MSAVLLSVLYGCYSATQAGLPSPYQQTGLGPTDTGLLLDSCWASVGLGPTTGLGPQQCLVSGHSERPAAIAPVSRTGVRIVSGNYSRDTEY